MFDMTIAFPLSGHGRPPQKDVFGARYTARLYLCERFDRSVARHRASREAKATGEVLPCATLAFATLPRIRADAP